MSLDRTLQRELRLLRAYAAVSGAALIALSVAAFRRSAAPARFDEINVHRINVVEPDGKLRMVISNKAQSIGPIARGKPFGYPGGTRPGIIFFNDEETEDGGLVFEGAKTNGQLKANAQLSFDQYDQDQVVYLRYVDEKGERTMGLYVDDRPDIPGLFEAIRRLDSMPPGAAKDSARGRLFASHNGVPADAHRVFVGRDPARNASLRLSDPQGRTRLRLVVDSLGAARIEFLDDSGHVVRSLWNARSSPVSDQRRSPTNESPLVGPLSSRSRPYAVAPPMANDRAVACRRWSQ